MEGVIYMERGKRMSRDELEYFNVKVSEVNKLEAAERPKSRWSLETVLCNRCNAFFYAVYPENTKDLLKSTINIEYGCGNGKKQHPFYEEVQFTQTDFKRILSRRNGQTRQ